MTHNEGRERGQDCDESDYDEEIDEITDRLPDYDDDDDDEEDETEEAAPNDGGFSAYSAEDLENARWLGYDLADLKFQMRTRPKGFVPPTPSELRGRVENEKAQYAFQEQQRKERERREAQIPKPQYYDPDQALTPEGREAVRLAERLDLPGNRIVNKFDGDRNNYLLERTIEHRMSTYPRDAENVVLLETDAAQYLYSLLGDAGMHGHWIAARYLGTPYVEHTLFGKTVWAVGSMQFLRDVTRVLGRMPLTLKTYYQEPETINFETNGEETWLAWLESNARLYTYEPPDASALSAHPGDHEAVYIAQTTEIAATLNNAYAKHKNEDYLKRANRVGDIAVTITGDISDGVPALEGKSIYIFPFWSAEGFAWAESVKAALGDAWIIETPCNEGETLGQAIERNGDRLICDGMGYPKLWHAHLRRIEVERIAAEKQRVLDERAARAGQPLVKNIFRNTGFSLLISEPHGGKTFNGIRLAYDLAHAEKLWGERICENVWTVFFEADDPHSIESYRQSIPNADCVTFVTETLPKLLKGSHDKINDNAIDAYCEHIERANLEAEKTGKRVGFVQIDSLTDVAGWGPGGENNSTQGNLVGEALRKIGDDTGTHVLAYHHLGKDAKKGGRGTTALEAKATSSIFLRGVKRRERIVAGELYLARTKIGESHRTLGTYELVTVEIGKDADGDPVTTKRVSWSTDLGRATLDKGEDDKLPKHIQRVVDIVSGLAASGDGPWTWEGDVHEAHRKRFKNASSERAAWTRLQRDFAALSEKLLQRGFAADISNGIKRL